MPKLVYLLLLISLGCVACAKEVPLPAGFPIKNFALPPNSGKIKTEQRDSSNWVVNFTNSDGWGEVDEFLRAKASRIGLSEESPLPKGGQVQGISVFKGTDGWTIMWMQAYPDAASLRGKDKYAIICTKH